MSCLPVCHRKFRNLRARLTPHGARTTGIRRCVSNQWEIRAGVCASVPTTAPLVFAKATQSSGIGSVPTEPTTSCSVGETNHEATPCILRLGETRNSPSETSSDSWHAGYVKRGLIEMNHTGNDIIFRRAGFSSGRKSRPRRRLAVPQCRRRPSPPSSGRCCGRRAFCRPPVPCP